MFRSTWARGTLVVALALGAPQVLFARQQRPAPTNAWGMPVLDAKGQRIVYGPDQLKPPARGTASPSTAGATAVIARAGYASFGTCIGDSNIVLADGEIYVGGSMTTFGPNDYWYVLRRAGSGYEQVFVSRRLPSVVGLALGNVTGDAALEIVVARADGTVLLYDQRTRVELAALDTAASDVLGLALRDVHGDGRAEILLTTDTSSSDTLWVLNDTGEAIWLLPDAGGEDLVVGNMDDDPSPEIATTSGKVIDWATLSVQWNRAGGFGIDVELGDIDGDGKQELLAAQDWDSVWAYDVDTQLPKWSLPIFDVGAIWVGNADADPALELVVGDGQWGDVHAFNTVTLAEEWSIQNPEHGVTFVAVGDPNGNGTLDVLWGAGATSTGSDRLYVANLATRTIDWQNEQLEGPFLPLQRGDIDGDGQPELVTVSWSADAGYDSGRIVAFDAATLQVRGISAPIVGNLSWTGTRDLKLRNVDTDPQLEVVVAADRLYDGAIEIYDFIGLANTFVLKWTSPVQPDFAAFNSVDVVDVDADGQLEVVGATVGGSDASRVYVIGYPGGALEWRSASLTASLAPVRLVALTSGGGIADLVAAVDGESLNFFLGTGEPQGSAPGLFTFLGPSGPSGGRSFLVGLADGSVHQYDRQTGGYSVTWSRSLGTAEVEGVTIFADGTMAAARAGSLSFYPLRDAPLAWESADYGLRGEVALGVGLHRRPLAAGAFGVVTLAPWQPLLDVRPRRGLASGGTLLTALGTAFDPAAKLFVGAREASNPIVTGAEHMTAVTPPQTPCTVQAVTVVNPDMSFEVMDDAFTVRPFGPPSCHARPPAAAAAK